jgi:hypothetical protein
MIVWDIVLRLGTSTGAKTARGDTSTAPIQVLALRRRTPGGGAIERIKPGHPQQNEFWSHREALTYIFARFPRDS